MKRMSGSAQVLKLVLVKKIVKNREIQGPVEIEKEEWILASLPTSNSTTKHKRFMPEFVVEAYAKLKFPVKFHNLINSNQDNRSKWISKIQPTLKFLY